MTPRTLEQAFARFRAERDLEALAEVFDRTAPQLLEVARHLARGRGEAEDLVQATFLAALEGAERFEAGRELVPWLLGILAHTARRERERGARREDSALDELASPASEDPAALAEGVELEAALATALGQVPPIYREVLRSHLAEGRAPEEIARRLGRAQGTVRVQLYRGFRWLRRLLPAGFALGAGAVLAPRGLASVRAEVLRAAGAPAALVPLTLGGMLVAKKLVLVAVMLLLAVSGWWLARGRAGAPSTASLAAANPPAVLASPAEPELAPLEAAESREPATDPGASPAPESDDPYGALSVVLTWWDGTPAAGVPVLFLPMGEPQPFRAFQQRTTDAEGRARVERIRAGPVFVHIERLGRREGSPSEVSVGTEHEERITLARHTDVVGRVLDRSGAPVPGAQLWVREESLHPGQAVERTQPDGSFRVRSVPEGFGILATAEALGSSETVAWEAFEPLDASTRRAELRLRGASAGLDGTVTDPAGHAVAGARISVRCFHTTIGKDAGEVPFVQVASDEAGSFRIGGLAPGGAEVRVVAAGFAPRTEALTLEEGATARRVFTLDAGFAVQGSVRLPDGAPAERASVRVRQEGFGADELYELSTSTDAEGRFRLADLPAGSALLLASARDASGARLQAQTRLDGRAGETKAWDVVFGAGPAIRGRAVDEAGRVLAGWRVQATSRTASPARATTDAQGRFTLSDLVPEAYSVLLYAPDDRDAARAQAERVVPGGDELELVVRGERTPSAFVLGRVLDPDGKPLRPELWARRKDISDSVGDPSWSDGERFRIGPLLSGEYELSISVEGLPSSSREFVVEEAQELDLGDIALPRTGDVRITVQAPGGGPLAPQAALLLMKDGFAHILTRVDEHDFVGGPMFPGRYLLRVLGGNAAPERPVEIEVRSGETSSAEVHLVAGQTVVFDFHVPEGERLPGQVRLEVRDSSGALAFAQDPCKPQVVAGHELLMTASLLPFGRFAYSARSEDGWAASGELEVGAGGEPQQRVTVLLSR